jgi:hypothetical protein
MKLPPDEQKTIERMAPGVYSREGFLGDDTRRLSVIIDTDHSALEQLDVTPADLADAMQAILDQAAAVYGTPVQIAEGLTAVFREAMGRIPCPFGDGIYPKGEVELMTTDGTVMRFTPLSVHMIREHSFFQGRGSRYRIEPEAITRLLGLAE